MIMQGELDFSTWAWRATGSDSDSTWVDLSKEFSSALGDMPPTYLYIVGGMVGWQDLDVWDWFIHSCR